MSEKQVSKNDTGSELISEQKADEKLVQDTIGEIQEIYKKHHTSYLMEVGKLIVENFFDDDPERMRANKPVKEKSFNRLCEELIKADSQLPKKTWLYSAVNVYVDHDHLLNFHQDDVFQTYEKLLPSQRVEVARIRDDEKLVEFLGRGGIEKLSVRNLRKEVLNFLGSVPKQTSLVSFNKKVQSIHKQVEKWHEQIEKASIEGTAEKIKKYKKLQTVLKNVLKSLDDLGVQDR